MADNAALVSLIGSKMQLTAQHVLPPLVKAQQLRNVIMSGNCGGCQYVKQVACICNQGIPYTSYISRVLYFAETGKSWFYEVFAVFNFADRYVCLVPRLAKSNFRGF